MSSFMLTLPASLKNVVSKSQSKKVNQSGLRPVGHAVLLEPYEPDFDAARRSGLIIPENQRNNSIMVEMRAIVVELGDMAYRKDYQNWFLRLVTPWRPRCKPGDKIMVQSYSGAIVVGTLDGKQYRLVNDEDVFVQIVEEAVKPEFPH